MTAAPMSIPTGSLPPASVTVIRTQGGEDRQRSLAPALPPSIEVFRVNPLTQTQAVRRPGRREAVVEPGGFATRFVTVVARLTATEATLCDKPIPLYSDFQSFLLYSAVAGATHWDGGTLLRIRRLGVRIPPSAPKRPGHRLVSRRLIWCPPKFGTTRHRIDAQERSPSAIRSPFPLSCAPRTDTLSSAA
jgi:hypothetical protein